MPLEEGDLLHGRYRVLRPVGAGGMARVHHVKDEARGTSLVLKELRADTPELLAALGREFSLLMRIDSPFLTRVHDFGSEPLRGGVVHFYTAEWMEGTTIRDLSRSKAPQQWMPALTDALEGLEALHSVSVRHGDFTPENVLVRSDGRGVLIDLGCAEPFGVTGATISGTEGFIAPELISSGHGDARSDLFAVGTTIQRLHRTAKATMSPQIEGLTRRLCEADPDRRPSSVRDVLVALGRARLSARRRSLRPGLFGRESELRRFERWLARLEASAPGARTLHVEGPRGVGTTRLVREMLGRAAVRVPVVHARSDDLSPVDFLIKAITASREARPGLSGVLDAASAAGARRDPLVVVLEDADRLSPDQAERLLTLARALPDGGAVGLLVSGQLDGIPSSAEKVVVSPLPLAALREWTGDSSSERALEDLLRDSGGFPARVEVILSTFGATERSAAERRVGRAEWFRCELSERSERELAVIALVAAGSGELSPRETGVDERDLAWVGSAGWLHRDGPRLRLSLRQDLEPLTEALPAEALSRAHARLAEASSRLERSTPPAAKARAEAIRHLALAGKVGEAESLFKSQAALLGSEARASVPCLAVFLHRSRDADVLRRLGEMALEAQQADLALSAAARALSLRVRKALAPARLLAADALIRTGRGRRAEKTALRVLESGTAEERAAAWIRIARSRMQRGDYAGAGDAVRRGREHERSRASEMALRELGGAVASYSGRAEEAESTFTAIIEALADDAPARDRCRLLGQRAIAAFRLGRPLSACEDHGRALAIAESAGLDDLVAVSALNLGTAQQQAGQLARALSSYERGLALALATGRSSTELTLRYNLANLRAELGELTAALSDLALLEQRAGASELEQFGPAVGLLRAEIAVLREDFATASSVLDDVERTCRGREASREVLEAELLRTEIDLATSGVDVARKRAEAVLERMRAAGAEDLALRGELVLSKIEVAAANPEAASRLSEAMNKARTMGHKVLEAKLATERAIAAERFSSPERAAFAEGARKSWDRLAAELPESLRERFYEDPRRAFLWRFTRVLSPRQAVGDAEALRRLLSLTRRLNSSLSLAKVLDYAVEAAVDLTSAERGFLLLGTSAEDVTVAASRDGGDRGEPPSSSIVLRAIESEEAVLTTDAQVDPRFSGRGSVHAMRLKSVLCVPISTPGGPIGALYVDSRVQRGRFSEAHRDLLASLSDQAAIAVSNAKLHAELAKRAEELTEQQIVIERLSRGKDRQIEQLKEQVQARQRALELRYDYRQIIGRGPAMEAVLRQVDRIVDSTVNVVIHGESGTGKELVARALHWNGPRRDGPFVGVNCAALPETLLESELFGHSRGAFTGADRDKKGLMVEANGGTLFLDEIGEMPTATQAKLLRAIQEREVRPLGASKSVPLDIRLVCATHRDLPADVRTGRFREDLYYRIAVVTVRLPPLRDRMEDLPVLTKGILERLAKERGRKPPRVEGSALRAMSAHSWPGNVRELENVLTRAFVLTEGPAITADALELSASPTRASPHRTRGAYEEEERERILAALQRARWNVSVVSRTLGIPRNSLYRKLARYGLSRATGGAATRRGARAT